MTNEITQPELWPTGLIGLLYGVSRRTVASWNAQGRLGPLVEGRGNQSVLAIRPEVEQRLGPVSEEQLAEAWARYRRGEHWNKPPRALRIPGGAL